MHLMSLEGTRTDSNIENVSVCIKISKIGFNSYFYDTAGEQVTDLSTRKIGAAAAAIIAPAQLPADDRRTVFTCA